MDEQIKKKITVLLNTKLENNLNDKVPSTYPTIAGITTFGSSFQTSGCSSF